MALPALQLLVELLTACNSLRSLRRLRRDRHRSSGLFLKEARREALTNASRSTRSWRVRGYQEGIPLAWTPRPMVSNRSVSSGRLPVGVDRHLKIAAVKSRGLGS